MTYVCRFGEVGSIHGRNRSVNILKEVADVMVVPQWTPFFLIYEYELGKEAIRLTRERSMFLRRAGWVAYKDGGHRTHTVETAWSYGPFVKGKTGDKDKGKGRGKGTKKGAGGQ